jgi:hypothetical protein
MGVAGQRISLQDIYVTNIAWASAHEFELSAGGGSAAEHPICKHHRGGDVDREKPEPLMGAGPNEKIKQGRAEGRTGLEI